MAGLAPEPEAGFGFRGWSLGALFTALTAAAAWFGVPRGAPAAQPANAKEPTTAASEASHPASGSPEVTASDGPPKACVDRFMQPLEAMALQRYAAVDRSGLSKRRSDSADWLQRLAGTLADVRWTMSGTADIDVFIATLPDPVDSGYEYGFDTGLRAIRYGIETRRRSDSSSLFRDLSWLPWRDSVDDVEARKAAQACRFDLPGLVTFRGGDPASPRLTAVLLVGETAAGGAHQSALVRALDAARVFGLAAGDSHKLRIIGPSFSGTAFSLHRALKSWRDAQPDDAFSRVVVATGSALGGSLRQHLHSQPGEGGAWYRGGSVEFWSTTVPVARLQCSYLSYLYYRLGVGTEGTPPTAQRMLEEVALLHESGTEFGGSLQQPGSSTACRFSPGVDLSFPAQVSALRDAYEDLDRQATSNQRDVVGRHTTLDVSLRESRAPTGMEAPSAKTTFASDISVSRVLSTLGRTKIQHVVIQATDIADAIFLARRIRDVAPDVRLAFLTADSLLLHPAYQADLSGSIVVTSYPFLGSSDFQGGSQHDLGEHDGSGAVRHEEFENSSSEGIFNAVLALRGVELDELHEYSLPPDREAVVLPVWLSGIGRNSFVPFWISPSSGSGSPWPETLFPLTSMSPTSPKDVDSARKRALAALKQARLLVSDEVILPRLWRFVLLALGIAFVVDFFRLRQARRTFSLEPFPEKLDETSDRAGDHAIVRTKWKLYAAIRAFVLAAAFNYMAVLWIMGAGIRNWKPPITHAALLGASLIALLSAAWRAWEFADDYVKFGRSAGCWSPVIATHGALVAISRHARAWWKSFANLGQPGPPCTERVSSAESQPAVSHRETVAEVLDRDPMDLWDHWTLALGVARADADVSPAKLSFAQLRLLANLALAVALSFLVLQGIALSDSIELRNESPAQVTQTLLVLRSLSLIGGVSPATPTLLCLAVVYVWASGRMSRLSLVHGLSRISPPDGIADLVSTPIRLILYPNHPRDVWDDSFTKVERRAVNTVVRPVTGPRYCLALFLSLLLPIGIFAFSPPSSLECSSANGLLVVGLFLCSALTCNTLIQLFQYWGALEQLLKRVLEHRLGRAFERVAPFVRDSLHDQVTRTPNDVLRLAAAASQFDDLIRWGTRLRDSRLLPAAKLEEFNQMRKALGDRRSAAISAANSRVVEQAADQEEALGRAVINAANGIMKQLVLAWRDALPATPSRAKPKAVPMVAAVAHTPAIASSGSRGGRAAAAALAPGWTAVDSPPPSVDFKRDDSLPAAESLSPNSLSELILPGSAAAGALPESPPSILPSGVTPEHEADKALATVAWRYTKLEVRWLQDAEAFAATVAALLLNRHVRQLSYFAYTLLACTFLSTLTVVSYPFEPHRLLRTWSWCLVVATVGVSLWVYTELDRNALLSRIAATPAGRLTFNREFVVRILAWGIIPLSAAAAAQYPDLANNIVRIIAPFGMAR